MERFKPFRCRISGLLLAGNSLNLWNLSNLRIVSTSGSGFKSFWFILAQMRQQLDCDRLLVLG
jgi:hypothetical protein